MEPKCRTRGLLLPGLAAAAMVITLLALLLHSRDVGRERLELGRVAEAPRGGARLGAPSAVEPATDALAGAPDVAQRSPRTTGEPGWELAGEVRDARSQLPLRASVEAWPAQARRVGPALEATCDAEGRFRLEVDADAGFELLVRAAGHRPRSVWLRPGAAELILLEPRTDALEGTTYGPDGALAGVRVRVLGPEEEPAPETTSGPDGGYRVEGLRPTLAVRPDTWIVASKPGHATVAEPLAGIAAELRRVDLYLEPERLLWVSCVRGEDGAPLAGAEVVACGGTAGELALGEPVVTEEGGTARLQGVPRGACWLRVALPGYVEQSLPLGPSATAPGEIEDVVVRLAAGAAVQGRLVGPAGEDLAGRLTFQPVGLPPSRWAETTWRSPRRHALASPGAFRFDGLVPEVAYRLIVEAPGFAPASPGKEIRVQSGAMVDLGVLRLEPGRTLGGRVVDRQRRAVAGARLRVRGSLDHWIESFSWWAPPSDADGRFRIEHLPPSPVTLDAFGEGASAERRVEPEEREIELVLGTGEGWTFSARCVDEQGAPLEGARLTLAVADLAGRDRRRTSAESGPGGLLEVPVADAPDVLVEGAGPGRQLRGAPLWVPRGTEGVELVLVRSRTLSGRVVAVLDGRPLPGATLVWTPLAPALGSEDGDGAAAQRWDARAGPLGSFSLSVPSGVEGVLEVAREGYEGLSLTVPAAETDVELGELALVRHGRVVALVLDERGEPLRGAAVRIEELEEHGWPLHRTTDAAGRAELSVPPGRHRVVASFGAEEQVEELSCEGPGPWELRFEGFRHEQVAARLRLLDPEGLVLPAGVPVVLASRAALHHAETDEEGYVRFEDLAPDTYSLRVHLPERGLRGCSVEVPSGGDFDGEARLEEPR